jgi:hypothetical protein
MRVAPEDRRNLAFEFDQVLRHIQHWIAHSTVMGESLASDEYVRNCERDGDRRQRPEI